MATYSKLFIVQFGASKTGLTGTVGFALYNADNTLNTARTTAGITERGSGTGQYAATVTVPSAFQGEIRWDTGGASPIYASEEINHTVDAQEAADILLARPMTTAEATADDHSLCYVVLVCSEMSLNPSTGALTVKKSDGSTTFASKTATTTSGTSPITGMA